MLLQGASKSQCAAPIDVLVAVTTSKQKPTRCSIEKISMEVTSSAAIATTGDNNEHHVHSTNQKYDLLTSFLGPLCVQTNLHRADRMDCAICVKWLAQSSQNVLYNLCELNCTEKPKRSVWTDSHSSQLRPKIQSGIFLEIETLFSSPNFLSGGNLGNKIFIC